MYKKTEEKIQASASLLWEIHANRDRYGKILHLLEEPYQLTLAIMEFSPVLSDEEIANSIFLNYQIVRRIRRLIGH